MRLLSLVLAILLLSGVLAFIGPIPTYSQAEQLSLESYDWPQGGQLSILVRNVGSAPVNIGSAKYFINGLVVESSSTCGLTLNPNQSCAIILTPSTSSLVVGTAYPLKIGTADGSIFSFTVTYGGSNFQLTNSQSIIEQQSVTSETPAAPQAAIQQILSDYLVANIYPVIGAITGGVLLFGVLLGLFAVRTGRTTIDEIYGEDEPRRPGKRNVPTLIIIGGVAIGILTLSIVTPLLRLNFSFAAGIPYLAPVISLLALAGSILTLLGMIKSVLSGRRKNLRGEDSDSEMELAVSSRPEPDEAELDEAPIQPQQVKKRCNYCGADVRVEDSICGKCGMPAMYRK